MAITVKELQTLIYLKKNGFLNRLASIIEIGAQQIVDCMLPYNPNIIQQKEGYHIADCGLIVVLQKVFDTPYVPALDVPTGTSALNTTLKERYWSVFKDDAFRPYGSDSKTVAGVMRRFKKLIARISQG